MTGGEIINEDLHHDKTIKEEVKRNKKRGLEFPYDKTSEEEKKAKKIRQLTRRKEGKDNLQNFKVTKTEEEADQKMTNRQCFDYKDENGKQAAEKQESHNTYVMNGRQAARNKEGHNTYEKKIRENLKTVADLLYKYRCNLIVKSSEKHPCIFLCIKKV